MLAPEVADIQSVDIELSNRGPYSAMHPACPSGKVGPPGMAPRSLPTGVVERIFHDLAELGYSRQIMFSIYNEPMHDPRFFALADLMHRILPGCTLRVLANSMTVDAGLITDLQRPWLSVHLDAYTEAEDARMRQCGAHGLFDVSNRRTFDARLSLPGRAEHGRRDLAPCSAWERVVINHRGEVVVCCLDWGWAEVLADLTKTRLAEYLRSASYATLCREFKAGERKRGLCRKCTWEPGKAFA